MMTAPQIRKDSRDGDESTADAWFAGGERLGYDAKAHRIVAVEGAPLRVFLRREGEVAATTAMTRAGMSKMPATANLRTLDG